MSLARAQVLFVMGEKEDKHSLDDYPLKKLQVSRGSTRLGSKQNSMVTWNFHTLLVIDGLVYDLDSPREFPLDAETYFNYLFPPTDNLSDRLSRIKLRVFSIARFIDIFDSFLKENDPIFIQMAFSQHFKSLELRTPNIISLRDYLREYISP